LFHEGRQFDIIRVMGLGKGLISLFAAAGAGAWIYNRFMKTTGNLTQRSAIAATASGVGIFLVVYLFLGLIGF
jgi:hypothetical protein